MPNIAICENCGIEFKFCGHTRAGKFCCKKCFLEYNKKTKYISKICLYCKEPFEVLKCHEHRKFCSKSCSAKYHAKVNKKQRPIKICKQCKKSFEIKRKGQIFCSSACSALFRKENKKHKKDTKVKVYINGQSFLEHRLVMENKLNRKLESKEIVHHIDGNRKNNKPENLWLYATNSDHIKGHHSLFALVNWLLKNKFIKFEDGKYVKGGTTEEEDNN